MTLASRIALLERQLAELRQQQDVLRLLRQVYPPGDHLTAETVWLNDTLRAVCRAAGLETPRHLGRVLRDSGHLARIGRDSTGCIWTFVYTDTLDGAADAGA